MSRRPDQARIPTSLLYPAFSETPPRLITQHSFDTNGDDSHYNRLCHLGDASPTNSDLCNYAEDMQYMPLQPELFDYLFPICLQAWRYDAMVDEDRYGGYCERFPASLKRLLKDNLLTPVQYEATEGFLRQTVLDSLGRVPDFMHRAHMNGSSWNGALGLYANSFPSLDKLWHAWWGSKEPGHINACLRYLSGLMYDMADNPCLEDPHACAREEPNEALLWVDGNFLFGQDDLMLPENVAFLRGTLTPAYLRAYLQNIAALAGNHQAIAQRMLQDFDAQEIYLTVRLPILLAYYAEQERDVCCTLPGW